LSSGLVAVHVAESRTEVTLSKVGVGRGALLRGFGRGDQMVSRDIIVEQERRSQMQPTSVGSANGQIMSGRATTRSQECPRLFREGTSYE
ncbi:hypothetical protein KCU88_g56, partial [Aureobasidium melanogenum]